MAEPRVVFDTLSFSNFLLSDSMDILKMRFRRKAVITIEVYDELAAAEHWDSRFKKVEQALDEGWLLLLNMTRHEHREWLGLVTGLGKGEASCIAVAAHRTYTVATDDRAARRECLSRGIVLTGTIGILLAACRDKQITPSQADEIHGRMVSEGFFSPVKNISILPRMILPRGSHCTAAPTGSVLTGAKHERSTCSSSRCGPGYRGPHPTR